MNETIRIIVVDDEDSIRRRCVRLLSNQGYEVVGASDSQGALKLIQSDHFDLMLVDIRMPGMDGLELMQRIKARHPALETVVMTAYASVDTAVKAIKLGAYDYLAKPFDTEELIHLIGNLVDKIRSQREIKELRTKLERQRELPLLVGDSPAMQEVKRIVEKVAKVDCLVSIQGESGTGKGLLANMIHLNSDRAELPFVITDCASLSPSVLESELFGHVKGSFTGANSDRKGYFETAQGGTLFLDEIGEMPLELQAKLLRAVQDQTITRIGESSPKKVDVRIITATNRDLEAMVKDRKFRHDLYYRINVISIRMPPLREHLEDVPLLFEHFLNYYAARLKLNRVPQGAYQALEEVEPGYPWPGNVRELENLVQRALVLGGGGPPQASPPGGEPAGDTIEVKVQLKPGLGYNELTQEAVSCFSRQYLEWLLKEKKGNISQAARAIGMRRTSVQRIIKRYGVDPKKFRS